MFKITESYFDWKKLGFALSLATGDHYDDHRPNLNINTLHVHLGPWNAYLLIPQLIKPRLKQVTCRDGSTYTEYISRRYGFTFLSDAVHLYYGIMPGMWTRDDPANSDHVKCIEYFWNYRHVRNDVYYLSGEYLIAGDVFRNWNLKYNDIDPAYRWVPADTPHQRVYQQFTYQDIDGELITGKYHLEEREWVRGIWTWLHPLARLIPGCVKVRRYLEIHFDKETGHRKGSWKGGTIGMGTDLKPGETHQQAWDRFCTENVEYERRRLAGLR